MKRGEIALKILQDYSVEAVLKGSNVKKGNFNIACPWCGDDPSQHLGINLNSGVYGCWRSTAHRGKNVADVLVACLGWSYEKAKAELDLEAEPEFEDEKSVEKLLSDSKQNSRKIDVVDLILGKSSHAPVLQISPQCIYIGGKLKTVACYSNGNRERTRTRGNEGKGRDKTVVEIPGEYRPIRKDGAARKHYFYLRLNRGFGDHTKQVIKGYDLRSCLYGDFANRILMPVRNRFGDWLTFTGRAVSKGAELRYKALSTRQAGLSIKDTVFNAGKVWEERQRGDTLVVTEGPFDAIKLDFFGKDCGVRAVAVMSINLTAAQLEIISEMRRRFARTVVLFDRNFEMAAVDMALRLGVQAEKLTGRWKDLGEMSGDAVEQFCKTKLRRQ